MPLRSLPHVYIHTPFHYLSAKEPRPSQSPRAIVCNPNSFGTVRSDLGEGGGRGEDDGHHHLTENSGRAVQAVRAVRATGSPTGPTGPTAERAPRRAARQEQPRATQHRRRADALARLRQAAAGEERLRHSGARTGPVREGLRPAPASPGPSAVGQPADTPVMNIS